MRQLLFIAQACVQGAAPSTWKFAAEAGQICRLCESVYKGTLNNYGAKMERQDREKQKFQKMLAGGVFCGMVIWKIHI